MLAAKVSALGLDAAAIDWTPGFEIPARGVPAEGGLFDLSGLEAASAALAGWFGNGFTT